MFLPELEDDELELEPLELPEFFLPVDLTVIDRYPQQFDKDSFLETLISTAIEQFLEFQQMGFSINEFLSGKPLFLTCKHNRSIIRAV